MASVPFKLECRAAGRFPTVCNGSDDSARTAALSVCRCQLCERVISRIRHSHHWPRATCVSHSSDLHMRAHALTARLVEPSLRLQFLYLFVSGGHTQLTLNCSATAPTSRPDRCWTKCTASQTQEPSGSPLAHRRTTGTNTLCSTNGDYCTFVHNIRAHSTYYKLTTTISFTSTLYKSTHLQAHSIYNLFMTKLLFVNK